MNIHGADKVGIFSKSSAFPLHRRPFTETVHGKEVIIPTGTTLPSLAKIIYPGAKPHTFTAHYGFLTRDGKEKVDKPGLDDRYIFRSADSHRHFFTGALEGINLLTEDWKNMGLPCKKDEDRGVLIPDFKKLWEETAREKGSGPFSTILAKNQKRIYYITANTDILLKTSIVRTVNWGWAAVSYSGKTSQDTELFRGALDVFSTFVSKYAKSSQLASNVRNLNATAGDPKDTNPGYPYFTAVMTKDGMPWSRIKMLRELKGFIPELNKRASMESVTGPEKWKLALSMIDSKFGKEGLPGYPLCVAATRRQSAGYKWSHQFTKTREGLVTAFDVRGYNSQRVAWMVPYLYNLLIAPFSIKAKAIRMMLPGLYHDGEAKKLRMDVLRKATSQQSCYIAEADYSNYDRNIPVDLVREITGIIATTLPDPEYYKAAAMHLHDGAAIIWPDASLNEEPVGHIFYPGLLGLLSGVKMTSETGTLVNFIIHLQAMMNAKKWTKSDALAYCESYTNNQAIGSKWEFVHIQSDDSMILGHSIAEVIAHGQEFERLLKLAGLSGEVLWSDRFLMRHCYNGEDLPVIARNYQNTGSNEDPAASALIFTVGVAGRTDGLLGWRSINAFSLPTPSAPIPIELNLTDLLVSKLIYLMERAASPVQEAIDILSQIQLMARGTAADRKRTGEKLNELRARANKALAIVTLTSIDQADATLKAFLLRLLRDKHKPSAALMLQELLKQNPNLTTLLQEVSDEEHKFFLFAISMLGIQLPS